MFCTVIFYVHVYVHCLWMQQLRPLTDTFHRQLFGCLLCGCGSAALQRIVDTIHRRDKFTIHSKAVVCQDVDLKGDITVGPTTVIHPKATIFAFAGPIVIGAGCIIEEAVVIVNRRKEVMRIGDNNLFEIGCRTCRKRSTANLVQR